MPVHRAHHRKNVSSMWAHRTGGKVSLFNYNPSIAGGAIAVKRFRSAHHLGRYMHRKSGGTAIPAALQPNVTSAAMAFQPSNAASNQDRRKRLRTQIAESLAKASKKHRT